METKNLQPSSELLNLIEKVSQASTEREAILTLLKELLNLLDMDQALVLHEVEKDSIPSFGIDRFGRIIQSTDSFWISATAFHDCLSSMEPVIFSSSQSDVPASMSEHSIQNLVCLPIKAEPPTVVSLASLKNPLRAYSKDELHQFKVAARAAWFALQQQQTMSHLRADQKKLKKALDDTKKNAHELLFCSSSMTMIHQDLKRLSPFKISVLLQGESGTGKEEVAREIHKLSGRSGPFTAINCANLTETLLESELFGYTKGAFTGALTNKKGIFQETDHGTLFLDEIGDFPFSLQSKLLRVLQESAYRPIGSAVDLSVDVRIISASHKNLEILVKDGKFREDLFFRINEFSVSIPSLRERKDDLELLIHHFVRTLSIESHLGEKFLSDDAMNALKEHKWPGNVRELKSVLRTAMILSGSQIGLEHLRGLSALSKAVSKTDWQPLGCFSTYNGSLKLITSNLEKQVIQYWLSQPEQTQNSVAERLGISTRTLQRILYEKPENLNST